MTHRRTVWPWYAGVAGLLILDQVTKVLVRRHLPLHHSLPVLGDDFLRLTHVQNPGIAFGVDFIGLWPLLIFGWVAVAVLAYYLYKLSRRGDVMRWPVMLFLAGAVGNSIDRTLFGQVTDFVDVDFPDVIMARWAVFNVADACVTVGIVLLLILVLFSRGKRPNPVADSHVEVSSPTQTLPADHRTGPTTAAD
jgi:signal peptidase II